jgi:hypothetical protein
MVSEISRPSTLTNAATFPNATYQVCPRSSHIYYVVDGDQEAPGGYSSPCTPEQRVVINHNVIKTPRLTLLLPRRPFLTVVLSSILKGDPFEVPVEALEVDTSEPEKMALWWHSSGVVYRCTY